MRLDELANASRPVDKFVKEFLSKHQEVFQKVLHLFKKVLSSIYRIIYRHFYRKKKTIEFLFYKTDVSEFAIFTTDIFILIYFLHMLIHFVFMIVIQYLKDHILLIQRLMDILLEQEFAMLQISW